MFIVIKSEHYDCTNLICKKDTLEEAVAAVKDSMAQRINKNYHTGLTGADITHENEERYRFSFDFDENRPADNSEPRVHGSYDFWKGDDEESVEWAVFEVTTDKPFFLLSYEEYESIELTGFYDTFDEAFCGAFLENQTPSVLWCHPQNGCLLSLRAIAGDDQIAQWDTRYGETAGKSNVNCEER